MDQLSRRLHQFSPRHHAGGRSGSCLANGVHANFLTPDEAACVAGLIDGEGTVTLTRRHRNENRQLCVSISSTEKLLLNYVQRVTRFGKITNKRITSPRHSPSFTYAVQNRQALSLLKQILPWLKSYKRLRAELIIRDYVTVTPRNGKYSAETRDLKTRFEQQVLGIKVTRGT